MKIYSLAFLATTFVAIIIFILFSTWRDKSSFSEGIVKFEEVENLETSGLPDLEVTDIDGKKINFLAFKNNIVILNFWATWCAPCLEEVPSLISLAKAFKGKIHIIAVSGDENKTDIDVFLKAFPEMKSENIHIIWDESKILSKKFKIDRLPESFIFNKNLKLEKKIIGSINWHTKESENFLLEVFKK